MTTGHDGIQTQDTDVLQKNLQKAYAGWAENGLSEHFASMFNRVGSDEAFKAAQRSIENQWAQTGKKVASVVGTSTLFKHTSPEIEAALSKALEQVPRMDTSTILPRFELPTWTERYDETLRSFATGLSPLLEVSKRAYDAIDWEAWRRVYETWGDYGWIFVDGLPLYESEMPPASVEEADRIAMSLLRDDLLVQIMTRVSGKSEEDPDFEEAAWLFDNGHYKPCAMMVCALVDGALIRRDEPGTTAGEKGWTCRRRSGGHSAQLLVDRLPAVGFSVLDYANVARVYRYFFKDGRDFEPTREGELNRNFLSHGMATKPVGRVSCVKLFLLLDAILDCVSQSPSGQPANF